MDDNKNLNSVPDTDEEEGATTVLRAPEPVEEEEEGATTVLRATDIEEEAEGATTVLTGPDPAAMQPQNPAGTPQFQDRTVLVQPQMGAPMGQAPNGSMGMPMGAPMGQAPNGPMGMPMGAPMGQAPNGPMGMPMGASMGQAPNGPMGMPMGAPMGQVPNGPMGVPMGQMPNNGQMPPMGGKPPKAPKPPKTKAPKPPKAPKQKKDGTKKKKTGLIVAIIAIIAVLGLGTGAYFLFFTPEKRYERKMDTAQKAMDAANYEEAEDAYDDALDIFDDRIPAMNGLIESEIKQGDSDDAREHFVEFRSTICGLDADAVTENLEEIVVFYEFTDDLYSDAQSLIEAYKEGYDLTEDGTLKAALVKAYVDNADSMDDSDYEEKLAEYAKAVALDSANEDALSGRKDCAYAVLDDMMSAQQYDEAETFINTYADELSDVDFSSYTEKIESERALTNARHDLMEQVISLMSAGDYEGMLDVDGSENAGLVVDNMEGDSYVYAQDGYTSDYTGKAVGIYKYQAALSSGYYFYYGDYENGVRSGQGTSYLKTDGYNKSYEVYEGAWANDKPNGQGTHRTVNENTGDELVTVEESGNLVDGLFDGEVAVSLISQDETYGGTYTGTFTATNGDAADVRENYPDLDFSGVTDGKVVYVVLLCDGSDKFWNFTKGSQKLIGIFGFDN